MNEEVAILQTLPIWPDLIIDPNYEYAGDKQKEMAIADGLESWGLCMMGHKHPDNFGMGMVKIGGIIGEIATPENLKRLADDIIKK